MNVSHRLCSPLSPHRLTLYTEGVAAVSVMVADCSFHTQCLKVCLLLLFFQNHLHAVCKTRIAPLSKAVAWYQYEGTASQRIAVNKLDSHRSNQVLTAYTSENAAFTNIVFTETAVFNAMDDKAIFI